MLRMETTQAHNLALHRIIQKILILQKRVVRIELCCLPHVLEYKTQVFH
jgi:hypothetical protein